MNSGEKGNYSIKLDRLSICYNEPNQEYVQKTCGLLVSDYIQDTPWLTVTKNARYAVSCLISVPFKGGPSKHTVCFEAGPRRPGQASYRLDYNPAKICEAGFDDLTVFLEGIFDPDVVGFYRAGKVTRCDIALDLFGHQHEDSVLPSLDALWASWPETLIGFGLGRHLGVLPAIPLAKAA